MSYTSIEQVRDHLATPGETESAVEDQMVRLEGTDFVQFHGGAIDASTLRVKSLQTHQPLRTEVTLAAGENSFATVAVLRGSVVVASDSSLATVYNENIDYIIDYGNGRVTIKSGGALSVSQVVTVYYLPLTEYTKDVDFEVRAQTAEVRRLASGSIASKEAVMLDYASIHVSYTEELLAQAVTMANGMIEREINPDGQFETDPSLSAAATYRALTIIARAAASRDLSSLKGSDRTALAWMKLAESFSDQANRLLETFRPPLSGPNAPVHV